MMKCFLAFWLVLALGIPADAHENETANEMAAAATSLIAPYRPEQKAAGVFALNDDQRLDWHYIPRERKGIALKGMTPQQKHLTTALLAASLSSQGLIKASNIMSLEQVLQTIEGPNSSVARDPELYYVSIFGEPAPGKTWGWRFEGHHLSLSFTIVDGQYISSTPSMMGSNPAIVQDGPHRGLQILADEQNIGRELAKSLSAKQKAKAIISETAPADIVSGNRRQISKIDPTGIAWTDLNSDQQKLVWQLVKNYVGRARGEIAEADLTKITAAGRDNIHFAWAGGMERGQGHYYRIQGPTFLIEYDNTQNNANHIHCVYRDFTEDFGEDLLQKHYDEAHRAAR
jgi:Protein of unknown function (DUF3500)